MWILRAVLWYIRWRLHRQHQQLRQLKEMVCILESIQRDIVWFGPRSEEKNTEGHLGEE